MVFCQEIQKHMCIHGEKVVNNQSVGRYCAYLGAKLYNYEYELIGNS